VDGFHELNVVRRNHKQCNRRLFWIHDASSLAALNGNVVALEQAVPVTSVFVWCRHHTAKAIAIATRSVRSCHRGCCRTPLDRARRKGRRSSTLSAYRDSVVLQI
jgi:hypothetical protein